MGLGANPRVFDLVTAPPDPRFGASRDPPVQPWTMEGPDDDQEGYE